MSSKIEKLIPNKLAVYLWKVLPIPKYIRSKIMWLTNDRFLVAVLGLITNEKDEILLLKHTYRSEPWGIPSGWIRYEDPLKGLEREVKEETGFMVQVQKVRKVQHVPKPHRIDIYCEGSFIDGSFEKSPEISDFGFYSPNSLPEGLPKGQIELIKEYLEIK
jgi:8-oxo-dGTP diphosphatase